ncbi:MAG: rhamnulose-1-phosphate aldolase [Oscillospiraceae bacterium]|jgi:rhamnulose-1-phosphate aldolase|nr:rhamnulose-1-phosphate aldolase [Oscillospiraceae bacterium]
MSILSLPFLEGYIRMANDGFLQGWHERNGGNLTYRMAEEEVAAARPFFKPQPGDWTDIGVEVPGLAGEYFLATGSGKYFRNVILAPQDNICIAEIDGTGRQYRVVWGLEAGGKPTSEFPTHLMNHSVKKRVTNGEHRVIYHAHTPSLIALTYVLPLTDKAFSQVLWQSATECPVVFPGGVGVVEWMVPGGRDIAIATSKLMEKYDVAVWAHHGLFCSGPDFDITFGLMHTVEKSADIYVRVLSCGQGVRQTITSDNLRAIAREFGVVLREELLD